MYASNDAGVYGVRTYSPRFEDGRIEYVSRGITSGFFFARGKILSRPSEWNINICTNHVRYISLPQTHTRTRTQIQKQTHTHRLTDETFGVSTDGKASEQDGVEPQSAKSQGYPDGWGRRPARYINTRRSPLLHIETDSSSLYITCTSTRRFSYEHIRPADIDPQTPHQNEYIRKSEYLR